MAWSIFFSRKNNGIFYLLRQHLNNEISTNYQRETDREREQRKTQSSRKANASVGSVHPSKTIVLPSLLLLLFQSLLDEFSLSLRV